MQLEYRGGRDPSLVSQALACPFRRWAVTAVTVVLYEGERQVTDGLQILQPPVQGHTAAFAQHAGHQIWGLKA